MLLPEFYYHITSVGGEGEGKGQLHRDVKVLITIIRMAQDSLCREPRKLGALIFGIDVTYATHTHFLHTCMHFASTKQTNVLNTQKFSGTVANAIFSFCKLRSRHICI